jgi:hypothetical protein
MATASPEASVAPANAAAAATAEASDRSGGDACASGWFGVDGGEDAASNTDPIEADIAVFGSVLIRAPFGRSFISDVLPIKPFGESAADSAGADES